MSYCRLEGGCGENVSFLVEKCRVDCAKQPQHHTSSLNYFGGSSDENETVLRNFFVSLAKKELPKFSPAPGYLCCGGTKNVKKCSQKFFLSQKLLPGTISGYIHYAKLHLIQILRSISKLITYSLKPIYFKCNAKKPFRH